MSDLLLAGAAAMGAAAYPPSHHNEAPAFAIVTTFPAGRFDTDTTGIYLMPRTEFVGRPLEAFVTQPRVIGAESMDILPLSQALTFDLAVALGRQATNLVGDQTPEIDLGSAL